MEMLAQPGKKNTELHSLVSAPLAQVVQVYEQQYPPLQLPLPQR